MSLEGLTWMMVWVSMGIGLFFGVILASILGIGRLVDDADRSDDKIEAMTEVGLAKVRKNLAQRELVPIGICHWCNEYVRGEQLFCCMECSEDWEHSKERKGSR